jgi:hypothetical protein
MDNSEGTHLFNAHGLQRGWVPELRNLWLARRTLRLRLGDGTTSIRTWCRPLV